MHAEAIVHAIFIIFTGAAILATVALYARQALPVAYIALGLLTGPVLGELGIGLGLAADPAIIRGMAEVGIIFLLFLLGLNLEPQELKRLLREVTVVTVITCGAFWVVGAAIGALFGFGVLEAVLIGAAMMFSSTIIGLKLLPTSALHHQRMGEIIVSILLLQDVIAIAILLLIQGSGGGDTPGQDLLISLGAAPLFVVFAFLFSRYVITHLFHRFDAIREYIFLLAIGWCLGLAELGYSLGLSYEIGAFVAGVSLATNPVARFIAESLKPLRDFFLIMFFFALGASFDLAVLPDVFWPALTLAVAALAIKPWVFDRVLERQKEAHDLSRQIGVRLGQISEFSLLVAIASFENELISASASYTIQAATIMTFIGSSYWIVLRYPTPVAVTERLRRD
ncbi:cation:proton antiporter [Halofilum ochraceum]|uniref:cation:proton antiporter n=1 Tax=Halofilum ochraceum TaxID=1611323 RepID=UPI000832BBF2|nr:cation:proton antiporter [Halofilum ochraceum]